MATNYQREIHFAAGRVQHKRRIVKMLCRNYMFNQITDLLCDYVDQRGRNGERTETGKR